MENRFFDKKNGLWYEKQGDYYLPCLEFSKEENKPIGIWGQRHLRYLKQQRKALYINLLTSGKLNNHLAVILYLFTLTKDNFTVIIKLRKKVEI